ncbi:nuclease [Aeromonas caviae]|uniref:nuclease-related domain-containing protein n=1 Tax=Aeromonas caviae TaxID=648 RepID=UPI00084CE974|nr:nuclease-related domain-containing protein [Aeromonas caviae]OEG01782.1 nuclease [Aeromonas caviae]
MDITAAIAPLLTQLWFLLPLLLIATLLKTAWFKGMVGEWFINLCIRLFLDKREYRLLKDVTLPTPQGSTQIDHVIVSRFGVFVIETKNMKGWIFGDPRHKRWTQQLFRRRHGFQNPLHQNYLHLMTLKSLLGLADHQLHSIVYFIGDCTFKTPMPENVMRRGLVSYIKSKTTPVLSTADVDRIIDTIQQGRLTASWQTHRQHVTQLKTRHADPSANHVSTREPVRQSVANPPSQSVSPPDNPPPICPRCGSTMVLRTATRGENKGVIPPKN